MSMQKSILQRKTWIIIKVFRVLLSNSNCLKYLPGVGIEGVAQGDFIFTDDKVEKNIKGLTVSYFNPIYILYTTRG